MAMGGRATRGLTTLNLGFCLCRLRGNTWDGDQIFPYNTHDYRISDGVPAKGPLVTSVPKLVGRTEDPSVLSWATLRGPR